MINCPLYVAIQVTSVPQSHQYNIPIYDDMLTAPLRYESSINYNMIFSVHKKIITKKLSSVTEDVLKTLTDKVKSLLY
jgi:hypothetical protein